MEQKMRKQLFKNALGTFSFGYDPNTNVVSNFIMNGNTELKPFLTETIEFLQQVKEKMFPEDSFEEIVVGKSTESSSEQMNELDKVLEEVELNFDLPITREEIVQKINELQEPKNPKLVPVVINGVEHMLDESVVRNRKVHSKITKEEINASKPPNPFKSDLRSNI